MSDDELWSLRYNLLYKTQVSYRYHKKFEAFFGKLDRLIKAATVLVGPAIAVPFFQERWVWIAFLISSLGLISLVFSLDSKMHRHQIFAEKFMTVASEILRTTLGDLSEEKITRWQAETAILDASEPPSHRVLVTVCQLEQDTAEGLPARTKVFWLSRKLAYFF